MTWHVGESRYFARTKVRDAEGEHVGDDFEEVTADPDATLPWAAPPPMGDGCSFHAPLVASWCPACGFMNGS